MKKIELELKASYAWNIAYFFNKQTKKELQGNDNLILFGQLALLCLYNADILEEYGMDMQQIIDNSSICDGELYLNGFEGYDISERLNIKSLYLNEYNCIIASVYDRKYDRFLDFVM